MSKQERQQMNVLDKDRVIPTGNNKLVKIAQNNDCKSIVKYGTQLGSNLGYRFSSSVLNNLTLTPFLFEVLVGILLGDGNIRKPLPNSNPQIQYNQGFIHLAHLLQLCLILSPILTHYPSLVQRRDLTFYLHLHTRCLACLIPLYNLFILNKIKVIPLDIAK